MMDNRRKRRSDFANFSSPTQNQTPYYTGNTHAQNRSLLFLILLFLFMLVLKLAGYLDWSWWWVTSPLWAPFAVALLFGVIAGILYALAAIVKGIYHLTPSYRSQDHQKMVRLQKKWDKERKEDTDN